MSSMLMSNSANFEMPRETWGTVKNPTWPTIYLFPYLKVPLDVRCLGIKLNYCNRNAKS